MIGLPQVFLGCGTAFNTKIGIGLIRKIPTSKPLYIVCYQDCLSGMIMEGHPNLISKKSVTLSHRLNKFRYVGFRQYSNGLFEYI